MVKTYCVKQKKKTECVPSNEKKFMAKNGRWMMKCQCAECGITKTRLIKTSEGQGIGDIFSPISKGINIGKNISTTIFPQTKKMFKDYESGKIAREVVNKRDGIQTKRFWKPSKKKIVANRLLKGQCSRAFPMGNGKYLNVDCD